MGVLDLTSRALVVLAVGVLLAGCASNAVTPPVVDADSDRPADCGGHAHRIAGADRIPDINREADSNA